MDQKPNEAMSNQQVTNNNQQVYEEGQAPSFDHLQQSWVQYYPAAAPVYYVYQQNEQNPTWGSQNANQPSTSQAGFNTITVNRAYICPNQAANLCAKCQENLTAMDEHQGGDQGASGSSSSGTTASSSESSWDSSSSEPIYPSSPKSTNTESVRDSPESPEPSPNSGARVDTQAELGIVDLLELVNFLDNWMSRLVPNKDGDLQIGNKPNKFQAEAIRYWTNTVKYLSIQTLTSALGVSIINNRPKVGIRDMKVVMKAYREGMKNNLPVHPEE